MKRFLTFILSLLILLSFNSSLYAEKEKGFVNNKVKKVLKIRKKPNTKSKVKEKIDKGKFVIILKTSGKWYKIKTDTTKGWVKKKYISKLEKNWFSDDGKPTKEANKPVPKLNKSAVKKKIDLIIDDNENENVKIIYDSKEEY